MAHPFIPAANTAQLQAIYLQAGQYIENVWNVTKSAPFTLAELTTLVNTFDTWDNTGVNGGKTIRNAECTLVRLHARALDSASSPVYDFTLPSPRNGTDAGGQGFPNNVTFCITLQTGLAGRSYRGRVYVVGLSTNRCGSGATRSQLTAAAGATFLTVFNLLKTSIEALSASHKLAVVSYMSGGAWRASATVTPVTSLAYANLDLDSQRRRLPGRGR